ncbi:FAD-dependent oxidoreductase [Novosphingobium sp. G106]|uniref:flavin monoamine oxidase family protein n=1 Tax=Novosphingobium sp. G106 TaxID=2849500 RepID=UPI001C2CF935|nr:FAD-dependent oxidoreductase [Novosphingobium sp. G106]MBV1689466.1 FAD-dependent oxidoreductase [Novosphingobium sp. G106]
MRADFSRREVLAASAGVLVVGGCSGGAAIMPGELGGADYVRGHQLRDRKFAEPEGVEAEVGVLIAGGGVAGLATGWTLAEAGFDDFVLCELEDQTGGNARSGRNAISAYPLGAHYLPVPNREAKALCHMLQRFGMIVGEREGAPVYDPYQLCADLEERLFWRGRWQEGLFPQSGLTEADLAQRRAFDQAMARFRDATGSDGKPAFAIPLAYSSIDPHFTELDRQSFASWLDGQGWRSPLLRAYVRYCCRDDYGTEPEHVSAWAGIHYFASRRGWAANGDGDRELTWPEGNDRLAKRMAEPIAAKIRKGCSVFRLQRDGEGVLADCFDHRRGRSFRMRARAVVVAMPQFVAARLLPEAGISGGFSYAPWVVANVSVSHHPRGDGVPLAWDNVSAASDSLGYVVATHQASSSADGPTVLTWYMPLSHHLPQSERQAMLGQTLADWQRVVRDDLLGLHPELAGAITRIDVWRWGHAMIRPTPGFLTEPARLAAQNSPAPIFRAHSDISGVSLFEEAHYRGVAAAEGAMKHLGHSFESLL